MANFIIRHRLAWLLILGLICISIDQGSKHWVQNNLASKIKSSQGVAVYVPISEMIVVPAAFKLIYVENSAAAFSISRSLPACFRRPFLITVSSLATLFFLIWYFRMRKHDAMLLSVFCLIMGGAVGNLIDRIRFGYVVDFLDLHGLLWGIRNGIGLHLTLLT